MAWNRFHKHYTLHLFIYINIFSTGEWHLSVVPAGEASVGLGEVWCEAEGET